MEDREGSPELVLELNEDEVDPSVNNSLFLICKVVSSKAINNRRINNILQAAWKTKGDFIISSLGSNVFGFAFKSEEDVCKILEQGPWSAMGALLVLQKWETHKTVGELEFTKCPFWIQVRGLPLSHMNQKSGQIIAESIGEFVKMARTGREAGIVSPIIRLRILVNIEEPLRRGFTLKRTGKENLWIKSKYERLRFLLQLWYYWS